MVLHASKKNVSILSLLNITIGLHFSPSASGTEMKFLFHVVDDMKNAYAKYVRSGVK